MKENIQFLITLISFIKIEPLYASLVPITNPHEHQGTAHKHSGIYTWLFKPSSSITALWLVSSAPAVQTIHTPLGIFIEACKNHYTPHHDPCMSSETTSKSGFSVKYRFYLVWFLTDFLRGLHGEAQTARDLWQQMTGTSLSLFQSCFNTGTIQPRRRLILQYW